MTHACGTWCRNEVCRCCILRPAKLPVAQDEERFRVRCTLALHSRLMGQGEPSSYPAVKSGEDLLHVSMHLSLYPKP